VKAEDRKVHPNDPPYLAELLKANPNLTRQAALEEIKNMGG
jgi:hypothetical protein